MEEKSLEEQLQELGIELGPDEELTQETLDELTNGRGEL